MRDWIVTLPGIVGTLRAAMVGGTVNDAPPWRAPMPGWPSAPAWPFGTSRWKGKGLLPGDSSAAGDICRHVRGAAVGNGAASWHRRMEGVRRVDGDPA